MTDRKELKLPEEEQKNWSVPLILAITVMFIVYLCCTPVDEDTGLLYIAITPVLLSVLTGAYIYTYRGKKSRMARLIFTVLLLISLVMLFGFFYLMELGHAYRN